MATGFVLTGLTGFSDETQQKLISESIASGQTILSGVQLISGVKGSQKIPIHSSNVVLKAKDCSTSNAAGTSTITQVEIATVAIQDYTTYCTDDLLPTFRSALMPSGDDTTPDAELANTMANDHKKKIALALEYNYWIGVKGSTTSNYNHFDGFLTIGTTANGCVYATNAGVTGAGITTANVGDKVEAMILSIPAAAKSHPDLNLYMGTDTYDKYMLSEIKANRYNYGAVDQNNYKYKIPGFPVTAWGMIGMDGTNKMFLTYAKNCMVAWDYDQIGDRFDIFYGRESRKMIVDIAFKAGVAIVEKNMVVINY